MPKNHLTYLQFKSTAEQLVTGNDSVNIDTLYDVLGNIASKEDIENHFARWQHENNHAPSQPKLREHELEKSLSITRATLESTADAILIIDKNGRITDFNQKFLEMSGIPIEIIESGEENEGLGYLLIQLKDPDELVSQMQYLMMHPEEDGDMGDIYFKNGKVVERFSQPHRIGNEVVGRVWSFRDVTEKRKQEESLRLSNRAITASTHGVAVIENNENLTITSVNPACLNLLGLSQKEAVNHNFLTCFSGFKDYLNEFTKIFTSTKKGFVTVNCYINDKPFWLEVNIDPVRDKDQKNISHFVAIINDVTKNKELENILKYKAVHDALTGLPNKNYIEDAIEYCIKKDSKQSFGLLFIDIDRFKNINDTLGHRVGDRLLTLFGKRLRHHVAKSDIVSRVGGDEFIILIKNINTVDDISAIAERILKNSRRRFNEGDHEFNISASIGIVNYPECGRDSDTLIRNADIAMYQAKQTGRNRACQYSVSLNRTMSRRVEIENELHNAISKNEFELYYQPIYDLQTDSYKSAEALIRWKNHKLGQVSPLEFISVAEDIGMMSNIGRWVFETAAAQLHSWHEKGITDIKISLNVSPKQLMDENFVQNLENSLLANNIKPQQIVLELTESFFLLEGAILDTLAKLSDLGLKLSIDDFGTGYSNLSYLNQLHISFLKIDKAFIDQIEYENFNDSVLLAIIAIAKQMHYKVVAEGVESEKQVEFLKKHQVDQIQGYFFSKPLNTQDFEDFIKTKTKKGLTACKE